MFKIITSAKTARYQDDEKFDNAINSLIHILESGSRCGQAIPVGQLITKLRNADDELELSDAEIFMINACINAAGWHGGGDKGQVTVWAAVLAGKPMAECD